jgi:SulP family sulfate permease
VTRALLLLLLLLALRADALVKFIPTFAAAMVLWLSMTRATSPWALPVTLAAVPAVFHVYLLASGTTLAQAQDAGWVLKPEVRL